jgi:hypothetical protein
MVVNKIEFNLIWATLLFITSIACGCVDQSPARFEVTGLSIVPDEVEAGQNALITATIKNMSSKAGQYVAILIVNAHETENKTLSLIGNASGAITFDLIENDAGDYKIEVADKSAILRVKEKKPSFTIKQAELKWDNENPYKYLISVDGGCLVKFVPTSVPFTLNTVKLFGSRGTERRNFDVEILDENLKVLYRVTLPDTKFPMGEYLGYHSVEYLSEGGRWIDVDIPNVVVSNTFYVHMWNGPKFGGIHIGADMSGANEHSSISTRDGDKIKTVDEWTFNNLCLCWSFVECDQSKVNWMIRSLGTYPEPIK